jgi:hypothetical protein
LESLLEGSTESLSVDLLKVLNEMVEDTSPVLLYDHYSGTEELIATFGSYIISPGAFTVIDPMGCMEETHSLFKLTLTGIYEIVYTRDGSRTTSTIQSVTPTFLLSQLISNIFDSFYWDFDCKKIGEEMENSLLEIVLSVDDSLREVIGNMSRLFYSMGMKSEGDQLSDLVKIIEKDCSEAIDRHSQLAVGRLHQTLSQFTSDASKMTLSLPKDFIDKVGAFESLKLQISNRDALQSLVTSIVDCIPQCKYTFQHTTGLNSHGTTHIPHIHVPHICIDLAVIGAQGDEAKRLTSACELLRSGVINSQSLALLKAGEIETMMQSTSINMNISPMNAALLYRPSISYSLVGFGGKDLEDRVSYLTHSLLLDGIKVGDGIRGHISNGLSLISVILYSTTFVVDHF